MLAPDAPTRRPRWSPRAALCGVRGACRRSGSRYAGDRAARRAQKPRLQACCESSGDVRLPSPRQRDSPRDHHGLRGCHARLAQDECDRFPRTFQKSCSSLRPGTGPARDRRDASRPARVAYSCFPCAARTQSRSHSSGVNIRRCAERCRDVGKHRSFVRGYRTAPRGVRGARNSSRPRWVQTRHGGLDYPRSDQTSDR